jgi:hypothetical protein
MLGDAELAHGELERSVNSSHLRGTRKGAPEEVQLLKLALLEANKESWAETLGNAELAHGELERPVNS